MPKKATCYSCGNDYNYRRKMLGYNYCLDCGDIRAERQRDTWCIVLLHLNQKTR
jgi:hypothetical protein